MHRVRSLVEEQDVRGETVNINNNNNDGNNCVIYVNIYIRYISFLIIGSIEHGNSIKI